MLLEENISDHPSTQFGIWIRDAVKANANAPTAMCLSTSRLIDNKPSSRIVLMDNFSQVGIDFYTNYHSKKGDDIYLNPFASLLFFWPELNRQVRIQGRVIPQSREASDAYFNARQEGHKIGAWASEQSKEIESRQALDDKFDINTLIHKDNNIPRPYYWGGYILIFDYVEFWEGRENRMHDRIVYELISNKWEIKRLQP